MGGAETATTRYTSILVWGQSNMKLKLDRPR
jgi:hypothetical protein